jgi:hypothetical protein
MQGSGGAFRRGEIVIHYFPAGDTSWPVDVGTEDEDSAEWVLRYGTPERREAQRMAVASILSAYADLTGPHRSMKDATALLRHAREARAAAYLGEEPGA